MAERTGNLQCTLTCWGIGLGAGTVGALMMGLLGEEIDWNGAVFLGGVIFVALGLILNLVLCRPLPTLQEAQARHAELMARRAPTVPWSSERTAAEAARPAPAPAPAPAAAAAVPEAPAAQAEAEAEAEAAPDASGGVRPAALDAARDGTADDLRKISGVGPKLEEQLHGLGIYHFDQIAAWGEAEVAWMDANLEGFRGRVTRDDWVAQAKVLAAEMA